MSPRYTWSYSIPLVTLHKSCILNEVCNVPKLVNFLSASFKLGRDGVEDVLCPEKFPGRIFFRGYRDPKLWGSEFRDNKFVEIL